MLRFRCTSPSLYARQVFKRKKRRTAVHHVSGTPISASANDINPIPAPSALSGFSFSNHYAHSTLMTGMINVESPAIPAGNTRRMNSHKAQHSAVAIHQAIKGYFITWHI
jgi:hypothetical protein